MIHDAYMERTILGAMMASDAGMNAAAGLTPADFFLDSHRRIFTRMQAMQSAGIAIDFSTVVSELKRAKELDAVGGQAYVCELTEGIPRNHAPHSYVRLLRQKTVARNLINLCHVAEARIHDGEDPDEVMAFLEGEIATSQINAADDKPQPITEWIMPTIHELEQERETSGQVLGVPSGIEELDEVTTGWRPGELTYVGAAPGRGKTAFLLQSLYAAASAGIGCGILSLEMRKEELMRRLAVMHGRISAKKLRDPRLMQESEWVAARRALIGLGDLPVQGMDVSGMSPAKIARAVKQMYEGGARCIFVDFVQIIREDGKDRREAINRVSAVLRDTAKSLGIPFVVASQLARRDGDENRKPSMQDLRESGNLEQDASRVLLLYRPKDRDNEEYTGEDLILVAKQRSGVEGRVEVTYNAQALQFQSRGYRRERGA